MQAKKITLFLFLFGIFIFLTVYIGAQSYIWYKTTTSYVDTETPMIDSCQGYFFDVDRISYDNDSLNFSFMNKVLSQKEVTFLTIQSGKDIKDINLTVRPGDAAFVAAKDFAVKDGTFVVYPEACLMFAKRFTIK